jgi:hypothetical protein
MIKEDLFRGTHNILHYNILSLRVLTFYLLTKSFKTFIKIRFIIKSIFLLILDLQGLYYI